MHAHTGTSWTEVADRFAKEVRNLYVGNSSQTILHDANVIARFWLGKNIIKKDSQVLEINPNRDFTRTITSLRTGHF